MTFRACIIGLLSLLLPAGVAAQFSAPDTVCVGQPVTVELNSSIAGKNFYWGFCSGNASDPPVGVNLGNPSGALTGPRYITLVKDGSDCYSFITNAGNATVTRNHHGTSFLNAPLATKSWGDLGIFTEKIRGIQVVYDNISGWWLAFVVNGSNLFRLNFGSNLLTGDPQPSPDIPYPNVAGSSDLKMVYENGQWTAFGSDSAGNAISRLHFSNGLLANPVVFNLGNRGDLNGPAGLSLLRDNGAWYLFVANEKNNTLSRIDLGTSLLNDNPPAVNLGNPGGVLNRPTGISLTGDCRHADGLVVNHAPGTQPLVQLRFPEGATGEITALPIGPVGNTRQPFAISGIRRSGDTLFAAITNSGDASLSVVWFPPCTAASRPGDTLRNPPPFHYLTPGQYNINLSYTGTGASQSSQGGCRPIVAVPELQVSLGNDRQICAGTTLLLAPDTTSTSYTTYRWSTGSTAHSIAVDTAGAYILTVTNRWGCEASDTVNVSVTESVTVTVDTSLCFGGRYFAQGAWQTDSGIYHDTLQTQAGCDSIVTTLLEVKPRVAVDLGPDRAICPGEEIVLDATTPYATSYTWQDGSGDSLFRVTQPGVFWVQVVVDGCMHGDTVAILPCPPKLWFPGAFTPNNDGLNDVFRPVGVSITAFRMVIFDRWGAPLFETTDILAGWDGSSRGEPMPSGTYTYLATYETTEAPGESRKATGSFTLVR